jgi:O-antigen ligase
MNAETETAMPLDRRKILWTVVLLAFLIPVPVGFVFGWGVAFMSWLLIGLWALFVLSINGPVIGFWALVGLVILAPLPLGAVHLWSWGLMACVVAVLLAVWSCRVILGWERPVIRLKTAWPLVIPFCAAMLWAVVQSLSFTPADWHHPLWFSAADALGMELRSRITLNPYETISFVCRLLTYAGIFWLSMQYCRRSDRARQVIHALTYAGLAYTVYGLIVQFSGSQTILWFSKFAYLDDLTSSFVNRNSFATYAGLTLMCATGLIVMSIASTLGAPGGGRERLRRLIENMTGRGWSLLLAWIVILTALILSHSRAGFMSTLLGLATLIAALRFSRALSGRTALIFAGVCFAALCLFFTVGGEALDLRMAEATWVGEPRLRVYDLTMSAIDAAPILGTGAGTFEEVFRFYRTTDILDVYMKAHNTYLENILELGFPAALALFSVFAGFVVLTCVGLRRRRRDVVYPCIGLASTVLVAAHSLVDFSLQIPAVTATYCLIMGAACAQCWSTRKPEDPW